MWKEWREYKIDTTTSPFASVYFANCFVFLVVLSLLEQINMTLSLKKCHFPFTSVKVLGHVVSGLLMSVDHNKVAAIKCLPPPTTIVEVQWFLGMCGYYRQ